MQALEKLVRRLLDAHDELVVALRCDGNLVLKILNGQSHGDTNIITPPRRCKRMSVDAG